MDHKRCAYIKSTLTLAVAYVPPPQTNKNFVRMESFILNHSSLNKLWSNFVYSVGELLEIIILYLVVHSYEVEVLLVCLLL